MSDVKRLIEVVTQRKRLSVAAAHVKNVRHRQICPAPRRQVGHRPGSRTFRPPLLIGGSHEEDQALV